MGWEFSFGVELGVFLAWNKHIIVAKHMTETGGFSATDTNIKKRHSLRVLCGTQLLSVFTCTDYIAAPTVHRLHKHIPTGPKQPGEMAINLSQSSQLRGSPSWQAQYMNLNLVQTWLNNRRTTGLTTSLLTLWEMSEECNCLSFVAWNYRLPSICEVSCYLPETAVIFLPLWKYQPLCDQNRAWDSLLRQLKNIHLLHMHIGNSALISLCCSLIKFTTYLLCILTVKFYFAIIFRSPKRMSIQHKPVKK